VTRGTATLFRLLLLLALLPSAATATTLAVTFFDTNTTDPKLEPLGRGLASMLITDLSPLEALQVVERARMSELLAEIELQKSPYVDKSTAVSVGKGLGAEWVLTGAVATLEPDMRLDARLVEVSTGKVLETESVVGPISEFFLLEKELATSILDKLEVRTSTRETARMGRVATESFEAFVAYSRGLEALDRGSLEDARKALEDALGHDDRFNLATSMLEELQNRLRTLDSRRAAANDEATKAFLARIAELKSTDGPYTPLESEMVAISVAASSPANARAASAIGAALMDLSLSEDLRLGGPAGAYSINEWAMYIYAMSAQWLGRRTEYLTYADAFLERYPNSVMATAFASGMQTLLGMMAEEEKGRSEVPQVRAEALAQAHKTRCTSALDPQERLDACRAWFRDTEAAGVTLDGDSEEMWARAAARAGDIDEVKRILERSRTREPYGEAVEDITSMLKRAERAAESAAEAHEKMGAAKKPYDFVRAARSYANAGRVDEAFAAVEAGVAAFGEHDDFFGKEIEIAAEFGRRERAEAALKRWEVAAAKDGIEVKAGTARRVLEWDENNEYVRQADALALLQLAVGLMKIGQKADAADAYVELATKHPDFSSMEAASALSSAANLYYQAWEMEKARDAYELILDRYADSGSAQGARSMLTLLPE